MVDPDLIFDGNGRMTVLKALRRKRGVTQGELAFLCGCAQNAVSALESSSAVLGLAAEALGWEGEPLDLLKPVSVDGKELV